MPFETFQTGTPLGGSRGFQSFGAGASGLGPSGFNTFGREEEEPERGFLGTLIHEIGRDLTGAARTTGGFLGTTLETFGIPVPITLDDLTTRDLTGAGMVASMFVGAGATSLIRGATAAGKAAKVSRTALAAGDELARFTRDMSTLQKAATAAAGEGVAGTFFGAVRPLEADEGRLESVLREGALFAGLGGAFSLFGSAAKATIGKRVAILKGQTKERALASASQREETLRVLREHAGIRLLNPISKQQKEVIRLADGSVQVRLRGAQPGTAPVKFGSMNAALQDSFDKGYVERLGVVRRRSRLGEAGREGLDPALLKELDERGGDILEAIGPMELENYRAVRELSEKGWEQSQYEAWLGIEAVMERQTPLGVPELAPKVRRDLLSLLPKNEARKLAKLDDSDLLREAMLRGALSLENVADAQQAREFVKEAVVNGIGGDVSRSGAITYAATSAYDTSFLGMVATPRTLAKIHPEIQPLFDLFSQAATRQTLGTRQAIDKLERMRDVYPSRVMERVVDILDASASEGSVEAARERARMLARGIAPLPGDDIKSLGKAVDPQVAEALEETIELLNGYRLRATAQGRLGDIEGRGVEAVLRLTPAESLARKEGPGGFDKFRIVGQNTRPGEHPWRVTTFLKKEDGGSVALGHTDYPTFQVASDAAEDLGDWQIVDQRPVPGASGFTREQQDGVRAILQQALEEGAEMSSEEVERLAKQKAREAGLGEAMREMLETSGRAGYFPIVNMGGLEAFDRTGKLLGFFDSRREALQAIADAGGGSLAHAFQAWDAGTMRLLKPKEFGRLSKALREASEEPMTAKEAAEALREAGTLPSLGSRKFGRFFQERRLGVRTFSEDPFRSLSFYALNTERTLAFDTVERQARQIIDNLPPSKPQLKRWAETQLDIMMGRPTPEEKLIGNVLRAVAPEVDPRSLRTYSLFVRRLQSLSKLGGALSGVVNLTQIPVNLLTQIGAKWTTIGLKGALDPKQRTKIFKLFQEAGIDLGVHTPTTAEGQLVAQETVGQEIKAFLKRVEIGEGKAAAESAWNAVQNLWMFSFNEAERINRLTSAWGAYQQGLREFKMGKDQALAYAKEIVDKTQFDYSIANIPQLLQGPLGSVLGQFKTFFINEVEFIAGLTPKQRVKMLLTLQGLGGAGSLLALPGFDLIDSASRFMFDRKLSEAVGIEGGEEGEGQTLRRFASFGAPAAVAGIDFSRYIGPGGFHDMLRGWAGPTGSDAAALFAFFRDGLTDMSVAGKVQPDTYNALFQRAVPAQIRRVSRALGVIDSGEVRNPYSGKLIYRPDNRLVVGLTTAFGPPTVQQRREQAVDEYVNRTVAEYRDAREGFRKQIGLAMSQGDRAEAERIRREAERAGISFDARDMRAAAESFSRSAAERRERRTPLDLRDDLREFYGVER